MERHDQKRNIRQSLLLKEENNMAEKYRHPIDPERIKYSIIYQQVLGLGRDDYEDCIFIYNRTFGHSDLDRAQKEIKTDPNFMFGDDVTAVVGPDIYEEASSVKRRRWFNNANLGLWILDDYGFAVHLRDRNIAWLMRDKEEE